MKLKLQLVRDGEVVFETPISPADWPRDQLENESEAFKTDFQRFPKIFVALSHETRFRMMKRLMEEEDRAINFADFVRDLNLNPKIVWQNAKKLREDSCCLASLLSVWWKLWKIWIAFREVINCL